MTNTLEHHPPLAVAANIAVCDRCENPMRLYGIEPHEKFPSTDLHTYGCDTCGTMQIALAPTPSARISGRRAFTI